MAPTFVIGYDGSEHAQDALALARALAEPVGGRLVVVNAYAWDKRLPGRPASLRPEHELRHESEELLKGAEAALAGIEHELRPMPAISPAAALHEAAESEGAEAIVVGSSHRGAIGRITMGSVAQQTIHAAPVAVAVAPVGFRERDAGPLGTIGVAYDGRGPAKLALERAAEVAKRSGAKLRIIDVVDIPASVVPSHADALGSENFRETVREEIQKEADEALASLPEGVDGETEVVVGDTHDAIAKAAEEIDLLFMGSRAYGPARRLLLGTTAGRVVRDAPCPVVVVPKGAGEREE